MRAAEHCADLKVGYTDEKGWPAHFNIRPDQIPEMLNKGKTVCASVVDPDEPVLTAFLTEYKKSFRVAGKFFFNSYLSPDGAGFGLHLDHHPVSILQLEGQKRWWYSREPGLKQVISNVSFPAGRDLLKLPWVTVQRPTEESLCEVVLSPGDVLYLPKGCWHRAQAIGHSLGLTLAMESVSLLELIQTGLQPGLNTVTFRDALPGYASADLAEGMPRELEEIFGSGLEALRRLIDDVSPANLYAAWTQTEAQAQSMRLRADKSSATSPGRVNSTQIS
jgi:ribosomal protein L16 Arg81 hydroxylase